MALVRLDVLKDVREIVADELGVSNDINEDAHFKDDLRADSAAQVCLVIALETEFDLDIPDEDGPRIVSVRQAVEYLLWCDTKKRGRNPLDKFEVTDACVRT